MSSPTRRISTLAGLLLAVLVFQACGSANPYQGMTASQIYQRARQEFDEGEYDNATRALSRLFASFSQFDEMQEARMLMADAYYANHEYLLARSEYQRYQNTYPTSPRAAEAALGGCKCLAELSPIPQRDQEYTQQALGTCGNVAVDYAGTPQADEARQIVTDMRDKLAEKEFLNAEFYFRRELYDSAIKYYEFVVQDYPDTEWAPRALKGVYDANLAIGYEDLADEARQRLLDDYPDSPAAAQLAEAHADQDDGTTGGDTGGGPSGSQGGDTGGA